MFEIGWGELLIIGIVALIAIGPKELPGVLRTLGQWMSKLRRMASEFQSQFHEAMREAELADLKKQVDDMTSQAQSYANFDPVSEVRRELESTQQQIESAMIEKPAAETTSPPVAAQANAAPVGGEAGVTAGSDAATPSAAEAEPASIGTDPAADRLRDRFCRLLLFRQDDLQRVDLAVRLGRWAGEFEVHLYRSARIFRRPAQARDVRRGVHLVSRRGDADLHVRGARPLSSGEAGVSALPYRDADLLCARRSRGLHFGVADAGALFFEHAADGRRGAGHHRASAQGRGLSDLNDEAHLCLRHRLPTAGHFDAARPRRHHHLRATQGQAALLHRRRLRDRGGAHSAGRAEPALARRAADGALRRLDLVGTLGGEEGSRGEGQGRRQRRREARRVVSVIAWVGIPTDSSCPALCRASTSWSVW